MSSRAPPPLSFPFPIYAGGNRIELAEWRCPDVGKEEEEEEGPRYYLMTAGLINFRPRR